MNYDIEYSTGRRGEISREHFETDDPIACENFLVNLLEKKSKIHRICHNGTELSPQAFDRMIKSAAGMMAQEHVCESLGCDSVDAHYRFGVPA
jgi:hypothetical protein